ncbi:hypothetical protein OR1_01892 [Geobacter sp. OR-1]|uniref:formate dehydrogenase accessory protein FdhE n=1 Tax=Geobacter sp. OR-1 TaxID=1266765 RepID=UPI000543146C|nr:formate dehydrogenase accessory protein FdhE [Geobacter sp. OR-1]GAM09612.1 hypothetical protein OR1_01892 [Geobacter sp. OR-1]
MASIEDKLAALRKAAGMAPEYADILPLFTALFDYAQVVGGRTGISVDTSGVNRSERIASGFPLVTAAELRMDRADLGSFLQGVVSVLRQHGKENTELLDQFTRALASGMLDPCPLILAVLERRRAPLDEAAAALGLPAPLLEYLIEIPIKISLELHSDTVPPDAVSDWHEAFCPICGSRPGMAELSGEEGRRLLSCSTCFFKWPFKRLNCPSCGSEDTEKLSYFTVGEGATRVDTCKACSRYIKTRDSRKGNSDVPLEIEDLLTIHLDLLASREGYERGK